MRLRLKAIFFTFLDNIKTFWYNYLFVIGVFGISFLFPIMMGLNFFSYLFMIFFMLSLYSAHFTKLHIVLKYGLILFALALIMGVMFFIGIEYGTFSKITLPLYLIFVFLAPGFTSPIIVGGLLLLKLYSFLGVVPVDAIRGHSTGIIVQGLSYLILSFLIKKLVEERNKYKQISITDSLTNINTLSNIIQIGNKLIKQGHDISVIVFDLNNFRQFNDTYGYLSGNKILIQIAKYLGVKVRKYKGWAGRLGGDEFIILIKDYMVKNIENLGLELHDEINNRLFEIDPGAEPINLSFSIGTASSSNLSRPFNMEKLLYNADIDMYYNKFGKKRLDRKFKPVHDYFPYNLRQLLNVLAEKDMYTYVHSEYSAQYAARLARKMELSEEMVHEIYKAGWLHDIGKILISKNILVKYDVLTDEEYTTVMNHIDYGLNLIRAFNVSPIVINGIRFHHEQWDGNGVPSKLEGEDIPIEARILKITDAFTAMILKRVYSPLMNKREALAELKKHAGVQFDPILVDKFESLVTDEDYINVTDSIHQWMGIKNFHFKQADLIPGKV